MCNVCVAENLIEGETETTKSRDGQNVYELKGFSSKAETKACFYSLKKNDSEWTNWFVSEYDDLAAIVSKGGFDRKPSTKSEEEEEWLESHFS